MILLFYKASTEVPWWYSAETEAGSGGFSMASLMCWYLIGTAGQLGSAVDQYTDTLPHHHSSVRIVRHLSWWLGAPHMTR